jgi:hypothetical protein
MSGGKIAAVGIEASRPCCMESIVDASLPHDSPEKLRIVVGAR